VVAPSGTLEALMAKLSDTALILLSHAAKRDSGCLLPAPKSLKGGVASASPVLTQLLKSKRIVEQEVIGSAPLWREMDGKRLTLVITEAGLKAISAGQDAPVASKATKGALAPAAKKLAAKRAKSAKRKATGQTKAELLKGMLTSEKGMTIADASKATGWLPHSVRGFMSGVFKKKLGLEISSEKVEARGRVYRIAG
jgi:hypothetical protein